MSLYVLPLLDACTIIQHALAVFHLQIHQMALQRLAGEMHRIMKIGAGNVRQSGGWGMSGKPSLTWVFFFNRQMFAMFRPRYCH